MSVYGLSTVEVGLLVSVVPVPMLVVDYTPIIERFGGMEPNEIEEQLVSDDATLSEALTLPTPIAASPGWLALYGSPYSSETPDLVERRFSRKLYPDLHLSLVRQFTAPFFGRTSIVAEHTAPAIRGDVVVRSHWNVPLMDGEPMWDRVVIVDLDVTDLLASQRDLVGLVEVKDQLIESKDQLIASVSHEIRTPLSSIVGFAHLLRESSDLSSEEREDMISLLVQQSDDLTNIVDDLLVAAKADLGELEVSQVSVDLRAQAAQVVEGLSSEFRERIDLSSGTARCVADPARVRQIIRNLISNAGKYGGPEITMKVESPPPHRVGVLTISDNGCGIPDDIQGAVFDAYTRGTTVQGVTQSLGLGLYISRILARRMGGDLNYRFENDLSNFELTLPLTTG